MENSGFTKIDAAAIERGGEIGPSAFLVYCVIARHSDERRRAWPGIDRLAAMTGLSTRWIKHAIGVLEQVGWVVVERNIGKSNIYTLPPVASREPQFPRPVNPSSPGSEVEFTTPVNPSSPEQDPRTRPKNNRCAPAKKFVEPTIDEIRAYCAERKNHVDPQQWLDHYESNGWKVGRTGMKDWKAAVRTWEGNGFSNGGESKKSEPIKYRA